MPDKPTAYRFDLRTLLLISSLCAVQAAVVGSFVRGHSLEDRGKLLTGIAAGVGLMVVFHFAFRGWRARSGEPVVRVPLAGALPAPKRIARLFLYAVGIAAVAGWMTQADAATAFMAGFVMGQATLNAATQLLFDDDYGHANFYPTFLLLGLGERREWKELTVRWGAEDDQGRRLDLLLPTPRTIREINLRVPSESIEQVQDVLANAACDEEPALDG